MQQTGDYPGPSPDDYANVHALNVAFIQATLDMKGPQRGRLAAAPFFLFSLREDDFEWWTEALADRRQGDLLRSGPVERAELRQIQFAALSVLWHLGRRNPYAVRIISGASVAWCELVMERPLVNLLNRIGPRGDLLQSRLEASAPLSERLLTHGTSSKKSVRRSLHFSVLQALLTRMDSDHDTRLSAAACGSSMPVRTLRKDK